MPILERDRKTIYVNVGHKSITPWNELGEEKDAANSIIPTQFVHT